MTQYRDDFRKVEDEIHWTFPRIVAWSVVLILLVFGLGILARSLGWIGNVASQPGRIVSKTLDADNVIYNYEWFKRQHEAIQATERQIPLAEGALSSAETDKGTFQGDAEVARSRVMLQGLRNQRLNYIAEYNARARMANRNIFMGNDLPERIEP
jgi:hypothetical protein